MTQDEIIKLAKAYGFTGGFNADGKLLHDEAFVVAVTEAVDREREACIVDIQMHIPRSGRDTLEYKMAMRMIERIRARGEK